MKINKITPFVKDRLEAFELGEINIFLGEDAADNLRYSLALAGNCASSGKFDHIVYLNFPFSKRKFTEAKQAVAGSESTKASMAVYHLPAGRTSERIHALKNTLENPERTAVIINCWEMATSNYRYREELVFALHELYMTLGMTIFVFAMTKPTHVAARRLNRAGLGKLSIAADQVISLIEEKQSEEATDAVSTTDIVEAHHGASLPRSEDKKISEDKKKPKDDLDARIEANRKKTLAELPALEREAKRTGTLRLTIDQALALTEEETDELLDKYSKIETIREPKKRESVNLSVPNFNDLDDADGHLTEIEEELEYA